MHRGMRVRSFTVAVADALASTDADGGAGPEAPQRTALHGRV